MVFSHVNFLIFVDTNSGSAKGKCIRIHNGTAWLIAVKLAASPGSKVLGQEKTDTDICPVNSTIWKQAGARTVGEINHHDTYSSNPRDGFINSSTSFQLAGLWIRKTTLKVGFLFFSWTWGLDARRRACARELHLE